MIHALQLAIVGVINGSSYALLAVGFGLILHVTGRFHIAYAITYALAGYMAAIATTDWGVPFVPSFLFGVAVAVVVGVMIENFVYWPLGPRAGNFALLAIFTAALGLSTMGQGLISIIWISSATKQIAGFDISAVQIGSIFFTNLDVVTVIVSWVLIVVVAAVIEWTRLGRMIRAVRSNLSMSVAVGISPRLIFLVVFGIGTGLGAAGAIFATTKAAVAPDSGQGAILYALTIAFLAGETSSPLRIAAIGVTLGLIESLSDLWLDPVWNPVIVYGILLAYAAVKPFNLTGRLRLSPSPA